jgi:YesN/AraC family two-component response regulator
MHSLLFVDDENAILKSLKRLFYDKNLKLFFADDGYSALEILKENKIDMVISDMRMPGMNGHKLLQEIQKLYPSTVRFILSGHTDEREIFKAVLDGSTKTYLLKPWEPEKIIDFVMKTFELLDLMKSINIYNSLENLNYLPIEKEVQLELNKLSDKDDNFLRLADVIEMDLGSYAKVLKFVNSSYFDINVGSLRQAITYLGNNVVRSILSEGESFFSLEGNKEKLIQYKLILDQARLTNKIMKQIYQEIMKKEFPDISISSGILHDIGMIDFREGNETICNHEEIGGYILKWWGIPKPIVDCAFYHHSPSEAPTENRELVYIVHLADHYAWKILGNNMNKLEINAFEAIGTDQINFEKIIIDCL